MGKEKMSDAAANDEIKHNDGELSYADQAATYFDDKLMNAIFVDKVADKYWSEAGKDKERHQFAYAYELALNDIFQSVIQGYGLPAWVDELADKAAKQRFENE